MKKKSITQGILLVVVLAGAIGGLWYLDSNGRTHYATNTGTKQPRTDTGNKDKAISIEQAREIMRNNYIGPEDIQHTFGFTPGHIPDIPFSQEELTRAKKLGHYLVLYTDTRDGKPFTIKDMIESVENKTSAGDPILYRTMDIQHFENTTTRPGWRLTAPEVTDSTTDKNYLEQTEALITYLKNKVFAGQNIPEPYQTAVDEFENKREALQDLMKSDRQEAAKQLSSFAINQLLRENTPEAIYRLILTERKTGTKHLEYTYTWTNDLSPNGSLVLVGYGSNGWIVGSKRSIVDSYVYIGACLSRSNSE